MVVTLLESTAYEVYTSRIEDKNMESSNAKGLPDTVNENMSLLTENQNASVKLAKTSEEMEKFDTFLAAS